MRSSRPPYGTVLLLIDLQKSTDHTFGRTDWNGIPRSAEEVHAMSLANLHSEYCTVGTADVLLGSPG